MEKSQKINLEKMRNKKIALLGLGLDNRALLDLLNSTKLPLTVTICDFRPKNKLPKINSKNLKISYQLEQKFNQNLDRFDILFRSPGWPLACPGIQIAKQHGHTEISSPLNLFFALCPTKNIIGVTGSKGKGTTATLIYKILQAANKNSNHKIWLGGNIGITPLSFLKKIKPADQVVLELSSFQLEDLQYSPKIAVITNLFREHLAPADPNNPNFHASYGAYWRAKLNIAQNKENQYLVANTKLKPKLNNLRLKSKIKYFKASALSSQLQGNYNRENIAAAVAVSKILKIKENIYQKVIANFSNLEHRLEFVVSKNGIKYFDNSFSTTPESTALDLQSFSEPLILIAGGADKGADFKSLAHLIKKKVKFLVLLDGQATPRLKNAVLEAKFPSAKIKETSSMAEAVAVARTAAQAGDIILLSTACASFGLFKNYKERGDLFKRYAKI